MWEDWFAARSESLIAFAEGLEARAFQANWPQAAGYADELLAGLGDGLLSVLYRKCPVGRDIVSKTPSSLGLDALFRLFPRGRLLLLMRDGRAVAESWSRSRTGASWEQGAARWNQGARRVLEFLATPSGPHRLVRYEDLVRETRGTLEMIFEFLGLDPAAYPDGRAETLPVYGSSVHRGGGDEVHWNPVPPDAGFDPVARAAHWPETRHRAFNRIAGETLRALGYAPHFDD